MCSIYRILINNSTELSLQIDELIIHFSTRISWMNTNRKVNSIQTKNRILEAECNLSLIQFESLVIVHCYYVMLHLLKALTYIGISHTQIDILTMSVYRKKQPWQRVFNKWLSLTTTKHFNNPTISFIVPFWLALLKRMKIEHEDI